MENADLPAVKQPQLYDPKSGAPIALSPEEIPGAVASGKAGFLKTDQVPVINAHGKVVTVSGEEAPLAFSQGYKYEPLDSQQGRADQQTYGEGTANEALAGAAGVARGATLGLSDQALTRSGLVAPHTLDALKKYNPISSTVGDVAGVALPAVLTYGTAAGAEGALGAAQAASKLSPAMLAARAGTATTETLGKHIASTMIPKVAGSAIEGAMFGVGNEISEAALGDRDLNAQKLMVDAGLGSVIGGGLGFAGAKAEGAIASLLKKEGAHTASADAAAASSVIRGGSPEGAAVAVPVSADMTADNLSRVVSPGSIEDMAAKVKNAKFQGLDSELPSKAELELAESHLPDSEFPTHALQKQSLTDQGQSDVYKTLRESQTKEGGHIRDYEALQKKEGVHKLGVDIESVAPGYKPASTPEEAGARAIDAIKAPYEAEKKELGPAFKQFDELAGKTPAAQQDVLDIMNKAMPELVDHFSVTPEGLKMAPYTSKMGVSEGVYRTVKGVVRDIQDGPLSVSDVRKIREAVSAKINPIGSAADNAQLGKLKKSLMDYMEGQIEKAAPGESVREMFKRYAVNEQHRELAEYVLGGKLNDMGSLKRAIVPEDAIKKLFADSSTVKAVRELVGPDQFGKLTSDYLSLQKLAVTDKGAFSSNKFATFLKSKAPELRTAFEDKPHVMARIEAWTNKMRLLPDAPSVNPSGTAKTHSILSAMSKIAHLVESPVTTIGGGGLKKIGDALQHRQSVAEMNHILSGGKADQGNIAARLRERIVALLNIEDQSKSVSAKIASSVKAFVNKNTAGAASRSAIPSSVGYLGDYKLASEKAERSKADKYAMFDKRINEVTQAIANPAALTDRIASNTELLAQHAPKIAQSLAQTATVATQFLYAKAPKDPNAGFGFMAHTKKYQPSDAQISKWERYVTAVDHPLSILQDMKHGTMTREGIEAVKTVYPSLYQEMSRSLMDELTEVKEDLPYQKRLQLSSFFGAPVDASSAPDFVSLMQSIHSQGGAQQGNAPMGAGKAKNLNIAQNQMTDSEASMTRT